jgi:Ca2+-binding RTX toxin-like protein
VNNTSPETTITDGPAEGSTTTSITATFQFSSSERNSTFRCSLDGTSYEVCSPGKTYQNLTNGQHTFRVYAVGAGGEANDSDNTPASRSWTVATTTPAESCMGKAATAGITKTTKADGTTVLTGTDGPDVIVGSGGNDQIFGKGGDDTICGADGFDTVSGGAGNDALDGGLGADGLEYGSSLAAVNVNLSTGQATGEGTDTFSSFTEVYGSPQADTLVGDGAANFLAGGGGDDKLSGGGANDKLYGGDGYDYLKGNAGTDTLDGQLGGGNADYSDAAAAVSVNLANTTANEDVLKNLNDVTGSRFADTIVGNALNNWLVGGAGADKLSGADGNDNLNSRDGVSGNDSVDGGLGSTDKCVIDSTELSIVGCESVTRPA